MTLYNLESGTVIWKKSKCEDTSLLPLENFYPSEIKFMAATIAMTKNVSPMGIVYMFEESDFFFIISVGMNCRIGSDTLLFTNQQ